MTMRVKGNGGNAVAMGDGLIDGPEVRGGIGGDMCDFAAYCGKIEHDILHKGGLGRNRRFPTIWVGL